jgi:cold shock CspA family protein
MNVRELQRGERVRLTCEHNHHFDAIFRGLTHLGGGGGEVALFVRGRQGHAFFIQPDDSMRDNQAHAVAVERSPVRPCYG